MDDTNETQPRGTVTQVGQLCPSLGKARVTRANRAAGVAVPKAPRKRRTMRARRLARERREAQGRRA